MEKELNRKNIFFLRTDRGDIGIPCLWESLRVYESMSKIIKILKENGDDSDYIYISLKNSASLTAIREGYYIIKAYKDELGISVTILKILEIDKYSNNATVEVLYRKSNDSEEFVKNVNAAPLEEDIYKKIMDEVEKSINKLKGS